MNKIKIKLDSPDMASRFVNICSKYDCDVNVFDGSTVVDGKSEIGVFAISIGKIIEVKVVTSNEDTIVNFLHDMKEFQI